MCVNKCAGAGTKNFNFTFVIKKSIFLENCLCLLTIRRRRRKTIIIFLLLKKPSFPHM